MSIKRKEILEEKAKEKKMKNNFGDFSVYYYKLSFKILTWTVDTTKFKLPAIHLISHTVLNVKSDARC
jgi:hypothetical protein